MTEEQPERSERERDDRTGRAAARNRMRDQAKWVDLQIQQAMARGDFDNLPGAGKPIEGLGSTHDPDWWVKRLVEREQISVLPPALQLRKDDAELDARSMHLSTAAEVREEVEDFNARVAGPGSSRWAGRPMITQRVTSTPRSRPGERAPDRRARPRRSQRRPTPQPEQRRTASALVASLSGVRLVIHRPTAGRC